MTLYLLHIPQIYPLPVVSPLCMSCSDDLCLIYLLHNMLIPIFQSLDVYYGMIGLFEDDKMPPSTLPENYYLTECFDS